MLKNVPMDSLGFIIFLDSSQLSHCYNVLPPGDSELLSEAGAGFLNISFLYALENYNTVPA